MGSKKTAKEGITIVGGRPMHRAVDASLLPQGVEQVLTVAALDHRFREAVSRDPVAAAASKGIALDEVEAGLLRSVSPENLARMAERLVIPKSPGRRRFIKAVSASIVAMVTGKAVMLCSGCTGADSWVPDGGGEPEQKWMELAGHTCYVYLPATVVDYPGEPAPVMVALHGEAETCLSSVQRWNVAADSFGFSLIAVNWTEDAPTPQAKEELVADLDDIVAAFGDTYAVGGVFLSSRGASTPMAFSAGYLVQDHRWGAVAFLGGAPEGDWVNDADTLLQGLNESPPALYYVMGEQDADFGQATAFTGALSGKGVTVHKDQRAGSTADAVLNFSDIFQWLKDNA